MSSLLRTLELNPPCTPFMLPAPYDPPPTHYQPRCPGRWRKYQKEYDLPPPAPFDPGWCRAQAAASTPPPPVPVLQPRSKPSFCVPSSSPSTLSNARC